MSEDQVKDIEAETQNEIDQILSEVEELRKELSSESEEITEVVGSAEPMSAPVEPVAAASVPDDEELMKEFQASFGAGDGDSADMESTLSELKEDPTVKTLLDQTLEEQEERSHAEPEAVPAFVETSPKSASVASVKESTVAKKESPVSAVPSMSVSQDGSPSLTMTLTGSMTLRLQYEFGGQVVSVGFSDDFLKIELADGTEFKIPVGRQKSIRRVA